MNKIIKHLLSIFIGLFFVLLFLEIILRIFGWWNVNKYLFYKQNKKNKNEIVILTLGESMTVTGGRKSYPSQLEKILNNFKEKNIKVINGGIVHTDSTDVLFNLNNYLTKYKPDIVIAMLGINDYGYFEYDKSAGLNDSFLKTYKFFIYIKKTFQDKFANNKISLNWIIGKLYMRIGLVYIKKGEANKGRMFLQKAIEIDPQNDTNYIRFASENYSFSFKERQELCNKALKINKKNEETYLTLGYLYLYDNKLDKQLEIYKKALEIFPDSPLFLFEIGKYYFRKGEYEEAEKYFFNVIKYDKNSKYKRGAYELLSKILLLKNKINEANLFIEKSGLFSKVTKSNIQEISSILSSHNIPLVAVQYPRRDVSILKTYLKDKPNTYFVDNNESFEKAIEKYGYDYLFIDKFAGDFGHGSKYGNQLIAENVAKVILEEVLRKK